MLDQTVFIWGESENPAGITPPPTVSVSAWPHLFEKQWLRWDTRNITNVPAEVREAKTAFVNLFHTEDSIHIQQIRAVNPECRIVAMPDPHIDLVLCNPGWMNIWRQMARADVIAGRTHADCQVYGTLLCKPSYYLPSPIGPTDWFAQYRGLPREDYILTLDHSFGQPSTACNIAALTQLQREFGWPIFYASPQNHTVEYAELAGLNVEWCGWVHFNDFVRMTAKARLCVDMYTAHSYGRQQVLCGMLGTPMVGSTLCADAPGLKVDPYDLTDLISTAYRAIQATDGTRDSWISYTENHYGFDASRTRIMRIINEVSKP